MTKALVHGNPETSAIWRPLIAALAERGIDDVVLLSPPGFGSPVPDGFEATPHAYVEWLAEEVRAVGTPVDLLGHDWGAGHVAGLAAAHPELVRSWAIDIPGLLHPDYTWHDAAQAWQTPELGEQVIAMMTSMPMSDRTATYVGLGLDEATADELAAALDDDMGRCILTLYRGAVPPYLSDLADRLAAGPQLPSLFLNALDDPYVPAALGPAVAERLGASLVELTGQSHWWMLDDPAPAAAALADFWRQLDS
jgi:pimeloyl-ACP methyl ester carboxylesterase